VEVDGNDKEKTRYKLADFQEKNPEKFVSKDRIFSHIRAGDSIFIATGCGEPQYLVNELAAYVDRNPKAFFDTEIIHVWTMGVAPYTDDKFKRNFRHNSFFIGHNTRDAVNQGNADYTPVHMSDVPQLFRREMVSVDVVLIQTSPPDEHGYMSLGVTADITKAAIENASLVIAQVNRYVPRVHGDTFIHVDKVDFIIFHDEELLEYKTYAPDDIAMRIGEGVSRIIEDGDTIQVGYGSIPNAIMAHLEEKRHLGVHTELLSDGIVDLMRKGVVDNSCKALNWGKTVASFCMGSREIYDYIDDHPGFEFRTIDFTNNPLVIARQENMVAINGVLEIDLTGQATVESLGDQFYSGIGGHADFMRGAAMAPGGKTILAFQSTSNDGKSSRIAPLLKEGAGVTLTRGDVHYVVTEFGIAYLHGKNIRERAMSLIAIAHPDFQPHLIEEAKRLNLIYQDQAFIPGKEGEYPHELETYRTMRNGEVLRFRPVKISDEPLIKDFFYLLSDRSMYNRFMSARRDMPHEDLQSYFVVINYTKGMVILAVREQEGVEQIVGMGQYQIIDDSLTAEISIVVRDEFQSKGIGTELLTYITQVARKQGLLSFTAEVLQENTAVMKLIEKMGFKVQKKLEYGLYSIKVRL